MWGEVLKNLHMGNLYSILMLVVSFLCLLIFLERVIVLYFVYNINFSKFINNVVKIIHSGDYARGASFCNSVSKYSLPKITQRALEAAENDPSQIKGVFESGCLEVLPRLEARINFLPVFAAIVMMIGFLGTLNQLWEVFSAVELLEAATQQVILSKSIAVSLNFTAFAVLASIVIMFFNQVLRSFSVKIMDEIYRGVSIISHTLIPMSAPVVYQGTDTPVSQKENLQEQVTKKDETNTEKAKDSKENEGSSYPLSDIQDEEEII